MRDPDEVDLAALREAAMRLFESTEFQSPKWPPSILWAHVAALGAALYGAEDPRVMRLAEVDTASESEIFAAVPVGSRWRLAAGRYCIVMRYGTQAERRVVVVRCADGEMLSLSMAYLLEHCHRQADGSSSAQRLDARIAAVRADSMAQIARDLSEESESQADDLKAQLDAAAVANASPQSKGRYP